jgi:hypothetical protein
LVFWRLKHLNSLMKIRDPGWRTFVSGLRDGKKSDPGNTSQIRNTVGYLFIHQEKLREGPYQLFLSQLSNIVLDPVP